ITPPSERRPFCVSFTQAPPELSDSSRCDEIVDRTAPSADPPLATNGFVSTRPRGACAHTQGAFHVSWPAAEASVRED
ncbi:hypothetical protein BaRGS_00029763, partial [Batillaria attramentaria]